MILSKSNGVYRFLATRPVAVGSERLSLRAEIWVEDCGPDADPVYHVQAVERADTGETLERDDHNEDDWIEMADTLVEQFVAEIGSRR